MPSHNSVPNTPMVEWYWHLISLTHRPRDRSQDPQSESITPKPVAQHRKKTRTVHPTIDAQAPFHREKNAHLKSILHLTLRKRSNAGNREELEGSKLGHSIKQPACVRKIDQNVHSQALSTNHSIILPKSPFPQHTLSSTSPNSIKNSSHRSSKISTQQSLALSTS
eukprot:TRINITY_DN14645_c0_g1_i8.p1 TRINITY_DN14645_c0_g1~~TRINITY_DN14645_c0_g1_i8.p1  ORF type:complete len:166 (-),score=6.66 TRINITY_DN14645_c0_g1_i8:187-684(-)